MVTQPRCPRRPGGAVGCPELCGGEPPAPAPARKDPRAVKAAAPLPPHPRPPFPTSAPGRWSSDGATPSGFPGERTCRHLGALSIFLPVSHPTSSITPLSQAEECGGGGAQSIGKGQRAQNFLRLVNRAAMEKQMRIQKSSEMSGEPSTPGGPGAETGWLTHTHPPHKPQEASPFLGAFPVPWNVAHQAPLPMEFSR